MKKVTIYFKSGNVMRLKCKTFDFKVDRNSDKRTLEITGFTKDEWMIDLSEIEAYIITECLF